MFVPACKMSVYLLSVHHFFDYDVHMFVNKNGTNRSRKRSTTLNDGVHCIHIYTFCNFVVRSRYLYVCMRLVPLLLARFQRFIRVFGHNIFVMCL